MFQLLKNLFGKKRRTYDSDLILLPPDLASRSIDDLEIVLNYPDALLAIDHLVQTGRQILGWEGWLLYADGRQGHSSEHMGTASLSSLNPDEAVAFCRETIDLSHAEWKNAPELPNTELYFCITVA